MMGRGQVAGQDTGAGPGTLPELSGTFHASVNILTVVVMND